MSAVLIGAAFAKEAIGTYPTPVVRLDLPDAITLYVKRDDLTSTIYGGNKVRKLEYVFAEARAKNKTRLLTVGAVGSHHVLATAIHGKSRGFTVHAVLVPQPETMHALCNIRAAYAAGLTAEPAIEASLHLHVLAAMDANTSYIGLGGSSVLGSRGYVDAAIELAAQVEANVLPEPDEIVVALGSGGTVAGLLCGLASTKLKTTVVAVAISKPVSVLNFLVKRLTRNLARALNLDPVAALSRLDIETDAVGKGYGHPTPSGEEALALGASHGIKLDPTYTAKTFAVALAHARANPNRKVLFWNTLSNANLSTLLDSEPESSLPKEIRSLFRAQS